MLISTKTEIKLQNNELKVCVQNLYEVSGNTLAKIIKISKINDYDKVHIKSDLYSFHA